MGTDIHGTFQAKKNGKWQDVPTKYEFDRHYLLFAWLADVRNGFGFAGCPTHTAVAAIAPHRGLPVDFEMRRDGHPIPPECRNEWEDADERRTRRMGNHSHSWVAGEEIMRAVRPKILRTGIVSKEQFDQWDGESSPGTWCGGVSGPGVVVSDPADVSPTTSHVRIEWFEDTAETLAYFTDEVSRLMSEHGEIRFVFGFYS